MPALAGRVTAVGLVRLLASPDVRRVNLGTMGRYALVYVAIYCAAQFGLEFLRFTPLPAVQYASLAVAAAAGGVLLTHAEVARDG